MKAITLRNIPEEVARRIREIADESGLSLNKAVIKLLRQGMETDGDASGPRRHHDLDALAGSWTMEDARAFEKDLNESRIVDEELWV